MADLERRLVTVKAEKTAAEDVREALRKECAASEQQRSLGVRNLQRDLDALAMLGQAITAYEQAGKDEARLRSLDALSAAQRELDDKDGKAVQIQAELAALDDKLRNHDSLKRDLEDNVAFQQGLKMQESLRLEIDEKTQRADAIGAVSALTTQVASLDAAVNAMRNEQHGLRGRMETHKEMVRVCCTCPLHSRT